LLGSPGIQMVETRNAAAADGGMPARAGAILSMRLALAPVLIGLTYVALMLGGVPEATRDVVALYSLSLVPMALSLDWLFQGKEDFRGVMISRLLNAVVFGIFVLLLVQAESQVRMTPVAFFAGNASAAIFLGTLYRKRYGFPRLGWDPPAWGELLRANVPAGTAIFLAQSVSNLPPIVIGILLSNADAGTYSAGMKLIFLLLLVDRTLNALFLPAATRYAVSRKTEFPSLLAAVLMGVVVFMVPLLIGTCIIASPVITLIFGPGYEGAVPVVRVLTGYVFLTLLNSIMICTLVAFGRTKTYSKIVSGGALVVCVAVVVFTAIAGPAGAGAGIIAGESVMLFFLFRAASLAAPFPSFRFLVKPAIAGGVMGASALALSGVSPLLSLCISAALFVVVLISTGGLPRAEIRYLRERLI
ncbi:MAG TPA: oligosaccharide flippase family protein, partial [Bacteroidota bacterium]|nr:oligosaccharide flippase family protein [Bacteroidota bacterium]